MKGALPPMEIHTMSPEREAELARRHPTYDADALIEGGCAHGDGWFDIIAQMISATEVARLAGIRWIQFKEKGGQLRVYAYGRTPATALVAAAVAESATVCDGCGTPVLHRRERRTASQCDARCGPPRRPRRRRGGVRRVRGSNATDSR